MRPEGRGVDLMNNSLDTRGRQAHGFRLEIQSKSEIPFELQPHMPVAEVRTGLVHREVRGDAETLVAEKISRPVRGEGCPLKSSSFNLR